jgi:hypothetical protein
LPTQRADIEKRVFPVIPTNRDAAIARDIEVDRTRATGAVRFEFWQSHHRIVPLAERRVTFPR